MKNKKIVFLIEDLKFGGVEVSLVNLLNSADFEKHGYEAVLIMWGKEYDVLDKLRDDSEVKILKVSDRFPGAVRKLVNKFVGAEKAERIYNILVRIRVCKKRACRCCYQISSRGDEESVQPLER